MKLYPHDFALLVDVIDAYRLSLRMPDIYPEHSMEYVPALLDLRFICLRKAMSGKVADLLLTELEITALDEAVRGFIRVCDRDEKGKEAYPRTIVAMNQFHALLCRNEVKMSDELVTVAEATRVLGYSSKTVRRWIKEGRLEVIVLPYVKSPRYRVKRFSLDKLLSELQKG